METLAGIQINKAAHSKIREVDFNHLEFGKHVSDHMLVCDYYGGEWHQPQIVPYANLSLPPTSLALHYGQTVFEGMKAFHMHNGKINIFRIGRHYERFVKSLERMSMAVVPEEIFTEGLMQLIKIDKAWVPVQEGSSLYIRPFVYASESKFGVNISSEYRFVIFTGPVGPYYAKPLKVKVETDFFRAAKGGTGFAKCGGNYGGAFLPTHLAKQQGYDQVLWTDAAENRFIEESGTMNVMFVINDSLVTPPSSDTILDGVTRDSLLALAKDMNYIIEERMVSIDELEKAFTDKSITEAFGAGTAAVVAPIQLIHLNGKDFKLPAHPKNNFADNLKRKLHLIRIGKEPDMHNWNYVL